MSALAELLEPEAEAMPRFFANDVRVALALSPRDAANAAILPSEASVLSHLFHGPRTVDDLVVACPQATATVMLVLKRFVLRGVVVVV